MATRPTALITGASSGIGLAVSTKISQGGWSVVLVGRSQERLDAAHAELRLAGAPIERIHCVASDIGRTGEAGRCVRETMARHGRIDAVVNNAGTGRIVPIPDTTDDLLHDTFAPNVFGPAMLIAHAWNHLRSAAAETGRATIVNVSSMASIDPFPGFFVYAATKSALDSLTRSAAKEGAEFGIRAFSVNPGAVETPLLRTIVDESALPRSRTLAPADVAKVVVQCIEGARDAECGRVIALPSP
ncbi:MAG: SDR family oxidoreductase [Phycisphaerales bacterium]|nr:SDR family oxidoreductase [Phycisphaerales bacterium]